MEMAPPVPIIPAPVWGGGEWREEETEVRRAESRKAEEKTTNQRPSTSSSPTLFASSLIRTKTTAFTEKTKPSSFSPRTELAKLAIALGTEDVPW